MPIRATAGQIELNQALPKELRNYSRVLDKKGLESLLREVAERHSDKYVDVSKALSDQGRFHAQRTGGYSFGLQHMAKSAVAKTLQAKLQTGIEKILNTVKDPAERRKKIVALTQETQKEQVDKVFDEGVKARNPLALQILSGARGSKSNYNSLVGGDLLYNDNNDNPIPIPVTRTYSQGLSFAEYAASLSGARKGVVDVKLGVANAGYYNKLLNQVSHRNVVVGDDEEDDEYGVNERTKYVRGLPVSATDRGSVGSLLARDTGSFKANTIITPKILDALERGGHKNLIVRSPIARSSPDGGVYAFDVGLDENGRLVQRGEQPGMVTAQGVGEPVTQMGLNSKHTGGVAGGPLVSGFKAYEQMVQIPSTFQGAASHSVQDGTVRLVQKAPAGGHYVFVGDERHYVPPEQKVTVKAGESVEAGDVLSNGVPNPEKITALKGIGEGRRYWVNTMLDLAKGQNMRADRRNLELISRGLINHVRLNDFVGDYLPDDVVPYHLLEASWQAREGSQKLVPKKAIGKYLEAPILHHTVGVKVTPKMVKELSDLGLDEVEVHDKPPPFKFEMIRASDNLLHDPDPITRMYGSNLSKGLLSSVHRGGVSNREGTSFVPSLAAAGDFGREGYFQNKTNIPRPLPVEGTPVMKAAGDFDIEPVGDLKTIKPPEPAKMPWEKAAAPPPNRFAGAAPKNNLPKPGFSSQNPYQPLAGTAAQNKPAFAPSQQPQPSFQQQYGVAAPWANQRPPQAQQYAPAPPTPQMQMQTHDGFDYNTGAMQQPSSSPAQPVVTQPPQAQGGGLGQVAATIAPQAAVARYGTPRPPTPVAGAVPSAGAKAGAGRFFSGVRGGATAGLAGAAGNIAYDLVTGQPVTTGQALETTATGVLTGLGGITSGTFAAPAIIDAGKNLIGAVSQEDIAAREQELFEADAANKNMQPGLERGLNDAMNIASTAMKPVTSVRAAMKAKGDLDNSIASSEKSTEHAKGYFAGQNEKALAAPASEEAFAKVFQNNRAKADMELAEFSTELIKSARPGEYKHVEKMMGDKMQQRADIRAQLQMADSEQIPMSQEERAKLSNQLVELNRTINATKNELTNPSSFSPATLSKSLLQGANVKPDSEFAADIANAPEKMGWNQFHAAARLKDIHGEYSQIKKQLADPNLPYGEQQKLVARRDELDAKMREERKALKA